MNIEQIKDLVMIILGSFIVILGMILTIVLWKISNISKSKT